MRRASPRVPIRRWPRTRAQSVSGWATDIKAGPANESDQKVSFSISNDNDELFASAGQPAIDSDGTLTYTPAANESGSATVKVVTQGDGGTANGGVDTSAEQAFTIKVRDTTAPSVSCNATPNKLRTSANNHKLVNITANVTVNDNPGGSGQNGFKLISVTSSQADSGLGPGRRVQRHPGLDDRHPDKCGQLRAERYGTERTYTLTTAATTLLETLRTARRR